MNLMGFTGDENVPKLPPIERSPLLALQTDTGKSSIHVYTARFPNSAVSFETVEKTNGSWCTDPHSSSSSFLICSTKRPLIEVQDHQYQLAMEDLGAVRFFRDDVRWNGGEAVGGAVEEWKGLGDEGSYHDAVIMKPHSGPGGLGFRVMFCVRNLSDGCAYPVGDVVHGLAVSSTSESHNGMLVATCSRTTTCGSDRCSRGVLSSLYDVTERPLHRFQLIFCISLLSCELKRLGTTSTHR